ncbi:hypothetical protein B296_00020574 [Ensete ventricosum]|uniref:Uncharacterized protein n=1 Tax=Ensete ventricosum TaxID=4639 RepID=A0A426Y131_ENSVE|nr:hypothetical protein B296_00020574 [Ensete ventricosum]
MWAPTTTATARGTCGSSSACHVHGALSTDASANNVNGVASATRWMAYRQGPVAAAPVTGESTEGEEVRREERMKKVGNNEGVVVANLGLFGSPRQDHWTHATPQHSPIITRFHACRRRFALSASPILTSISACDTVTSSADRFDFDRIRNVLMQSGQSSDPSLAKLAAKHCHVIPTFIFHIRTIATDGLRS